MLLMKALDCELHGIQVDSIFKTESGCQVIMEGFWHPDVDNPCLLIRKQPNYGGLQVGDRGRANFTIQTRRQWFAVEPNRLPAACYLSIFQLLIDRLCKPT